MEEIRHGKVRTEIPQEDGSIIIETETFYDSELSGFKQEIEKSTLVDRQSVLKQILDDINLKSSVITLVIHKNRQNEPERVVTKYNVVVDKLGRKQ